MAADSHVLVSEMRHRVANDLTLICTMIDRRRRSLDKFASGDVLDEVGGAIMALALLYRQLYELDRTDALVDLLAHLRALTSSLSAAYLDQLHIGLSCTGAAVFAPPNIARDVGLVVTDLVCNAAKHAFHNGGGRVDLRLFVTGDELIVEVADDGRGLSNASVLGLGGGLVLSRRLARGLGGWIDACNRHERGTSVSLRIPAVANARR